LQSSTETPSTDSSTAASWHKGEYSRTNVSQLPRSSSSTVVHDSTSTTRSLVCELMSRTRRFDG
jgi:hypothetical protein